MTLVNLSPRVSFGIGGLLGLALGSSPLAAQDTPRPNRVAWFEGFPEPLPQGISELTMEMTSQVLRPDLERTGDKRSFARLDGEEWQLVGDWATSVGNSKINVRVRLASRSGGIADQAIWNWHTMFSMPQGGREDAPKGRLAYHLERDGHVIADLSKPTLGLMDVDVAWIRPFGTQDEGGRFGVSVQLPTGKQSDFSGDGGTDGLVGGALWKRFGHWKVFGQAEHVVLVLPQSSPLHYVLDKPNFNRAWASLGWQGEGAGLLTGLGIEVSLEYAGSPYHTNLPRLDRAGWQQHWTIRHTQLPKWRFGVSEEAGTWTAPDITFFTAYRFGG